MQSLTLNSCQHKQVHEIGKDFDKHGRILKIVRRKRCGLLIRAFPSNLTAQKKIAS
jgi:hypothetical protein